LLFYNIPKYYTLQKYRIGTVVILGVKHDETKAIFVDLNFTALFNIIFNIYIYIILKPFKNDKKYLYY